MVRLMLCVLTSHGFDLRLLIVNLIGIDLIQHYYFRFLFYFWQSKIDVL